MKRIYLLQEIGKIQFKKTYGGWTYKRLSKEEVVVLLGMSVMQVVL
jgi:hypothetical protein